MFGKFVPPLTKLVGRCIGITMTLCLCFRVSVFCPSMFSCVRVLSVRVFMCSCFVCLCFHEYVFCLCVFHVFVFCLSVFS